MSDQSDSQNLLEQQVQMSEGTSPSSSSDDGSRSTPSNLPKVATRQRKKRTSDSEDEDYVAEEEATSKRVEPAQGTKPGLKIKRQAGRQPMSKARASTEKPAPKEPVTAECCCLFPWGPPAVEVRGAGGTSARTHLHLRH